MIDSHRRDEYTTTSYAQAPAPTQHSSSPPTSASPFAFAPPPLSSVPGPGSRTTMPDQPPQDYSYYQRATQPPPQQGAASNAQGSSYSAYSGSHPMGYRAISGATESTRAPPPPPLRNVPTYSSMTQPSINSGPSPTTANSNYYARPSPAYSSATHSPRNGALYAQQASYYYPQATAVDMPRSLSYTSGYDAPYATYLPSMSTPALVHPGEQLPPLALARHGSTNSIAVGPHGPMGYFANRLPLVDRPFKCDQCVQSFNRNHDLKRHKRIHLDVKPFACEKCGKTFSRKDALRRHWMVRGCRGEEGATAPITPTFNPNGPPPAPALSPGSPPSGGSTESNSTSASSKSGSYGSNTLSFNHPGAPPPLSSLPPRQSSDQPSQILLTPNDVHKQNGDKIKVDMAIDPSLNSNPNTPNGGYFDVMRKDVPDSATSSTFSRYANSPKDDMRHHPYRRALPSPSTLSGQTSDGKPLFNMPFGPTSHPHSLLAPSDMDKNASPSASPESQWPRGAW